MLFDRLYLIEVDAVLAPRPLVVYLIQYLQQAYSMLIPPAPLDCIPQD